MKEPKRYYCGNGEGMFEDDKNGYWVEYKEHKAIVEVLTEQLRLAGVVGRSEQCDHTSTDIRTLRCNCCNDCGEILDVLD